MKKIIQILLLFNLSLNAFPQDITAELKSILNQISNNTPADQLFLHLDRNLYHDGDTIRFQAFIRDSQTGIFETQSKSLYVLLINSENISIDSSRFRISYAASSGWLKVPENALVGYYAIVAFTSDQMNYDPKFAFHTPIRIARKGMKTTNFSQLTKEDVAVDLRFLPEGGTFIYGVKQRLAFNAVSSTGKSISVSGEVVNQDGKKITEMRSGRYGPGIIEFIPLQGETYYARPVGKEFGNNSWPLPEPEKEGVSLRVDSGNPGVLEIILRTKEESEKEYFLTVTMNNILIFKRDLKLDTTFNARIKTADIPAGTAIVTLYDKELNPVAERLVFMNPEKKMKVQIDLSKASVRAGKETELTVNTTDEMGNNISSIISVSAIDSSLGFYSGIPYPDIESSFLYGTEFYNNLPQAIRCQGLRNIDKKSIDNLMMTYGWRKYTLKEYALACGEKRYDYYDQLKISNPGKVKYGREVMNLLSPEGGKVITLGLNENRETFLPFDSLDPGTRQIMVLPDDDPLRNENPITFEFPENKSYTEGIKLIKIDSSYTALEIDSTITEQPVFNPDTAILIESVTIKGHRKQSKEFVAQSAQQFKYTGGYTLYNKDFAGAHTFEDILYKLNAYYIDKQKKLIILRAISHMYNGRIAYRPALVVVDNVPIYTRTYSAIAQMRTSEIASVSVLKGPQGFAIYGNYASDGVVIVTTKIGNRINGIIDPNEEEISPDNHMKQVRLFRTDVEFYIPTKEEVEFVPEYQFRPTLLWKKEVYLDGSGPVKIKYPNNMSKGTVIITVNGASFTNLVGSNSCTYEVK